MRVSDTRKGIAYLADVAEPWVVHLTNPTDTHVEGVVHQVTIGVHQRLHRRDAVGAQLRQGSRSALAGEELREQCFDLVLVRRASAAQVRIQDLAESTNIVLGRRDQADPTVRRLVQPAQRPGPSCRGSRPTSPNTEPSMRRTMCAMSDTVEFSCGSSTYCPRLPSAGDAVRP